MFGPTFARRRAHRYRRHGLDKASQRMLEVVQRHGVQGASVLEIGGGVGELQVELLKRGAAHAVNLEVSPWYESEARRLLADVGALDRADRRLGDIAVDGDIVPSADVVVLHRVVCCYPDYRALLVAAAGRARRLLVFSHPPSHVVSTAVIAAQNAVFALLGKEYRAFAHAEAAMYGVVVVQGLRQVTVDRGAIWHLAAFERVDPVHGPP